MSDESDKSVEEEKGEFSKYMQSKTEQKQPQPSLSVSPARAPHTILSDGTPNNRSVIHNSIQSTKAIQNSLMNRKISNAVSGASSSVEKLPMKSLQLSKLARPQVHFSQEVLATKEESFSPSARARKNSTRSKNSDRTSQR